MAKKAIEISSFNDLVAAIDSATESLNDTGYNLWWRGQTERWDLIPGVFRPKQNKMTEKNLAVSFRRKAGSRRPIVPSPNDIVAWLILMQHYGLPTRLLDWTESALVAAYFCVNDDSAFDKPGLFAALHPMILNEKETGKRSIPQSIHTYVKKICAGAFEVSKSEQKKLNPKVVAFHPIEFDLRMLIQHTTFTIHADRTPMNEMTYSSEVLRTFVVTPEGKRHLSKRLYQFGIHQSSVFPDLSNLAEDLRKVSGSSPAG